MILALAYIAIAALALVAGIATIAYFCTGSRRNVSLDVPRRENNDFTMYAGKAEENAIIERGMFAPNGVFYSAK